MDEFVNFSHDQIKENTGLAPTKTEILMKPHKR